MGDQRVGTGGAKIIGAQPLQNLVRQAIGRRQGQLQGGGVGDAAAVQIGGLDVLFAGQGLDLGGRAMHQEDLDAQGAQQGHVQEDVGEILAGDDGAIHADDENLLPETGECSWRMPRRSVSFMSVFCRLQQLMPFRRDSTFIFGQIQSDGPRPPGSGRRVSVKHAPRIADHRFTAPPTTLICLHGWLIILTGAFRDRRDESRPMALVVFLKGVNVGGHKTFRPSVLASEMAQLGVMSVGAAGTFVVRKPISRAKLRLEVRRRLPFETEVMICSGSDIVRLVSAKAYAGEPCGPDIVRFVGILGKRPRVLPALPLHLPPGEDWVVRIIAIRGRFVFGLYRRMMRPLGSWVNLKSTSAGPSPTATGTLFRAFSKS